ncbi:trigger factor [Anaerotardibacter muris]|uniref:trigger factor n=1 Tax=Anaerotardibacter muris TaxID=2941505 RepID=UPI00203F58BA|nr:trigger factor [Anaerotardibacter muris]
MNTTVEALEDNKVKLSFEIDAKDVNARIKQAYKDFAKRYNFPGFRPGKAPRPVVDNMLGADTVKAALTEDLVNDTYPLALDEHDLVPLFKPEFDLSTEIVEEGKPFSFSTVIEVKPTYELTSYDPISVEIPAADATEEEIDAQIEELRNYYHDFKNANANTKVKPGEFVELTMKVTDKDGNELTQLSAENRLYELGVNLFPAAFDAELVGMKKGQEKSFDVDFTTDNSMLGQTLGEDKGVLHFDVTVDAIKQKVLPDVTDEWAHNNFGFENLEDMRKQVAQSIKDQKEVNKTRRIENECLAALAARVEGEMPEGMRELQEVNLLQSFYAQLSQNGYTLDQYLDTMGLSNDQFKNDMKQQADDVVRQDMALDAWARHKGIEATDADVTAEFEKANVDDPVAVQAEWKVSGRIPLIREGVIRTKALNDVVETATVTEVDAKEAKKTKDAKPKAAAKKTTTKKAPAKKSTKKEADKKAE